MTANGSLSGPSPAGGNTSGPQISPASRNAPATLLPLRPQGEPAFMWSVSIAASKAAGLYARQRVRPTLTMARWDGNVDIAARVADHLVDNATVHGRSFDDSTITLRLIIDVTTRELFIEVDDALPAFPGFGEAADQSRAVRGRPHGLWWVAHYRGRLAWDVTKDEQGQLTGKTVQAILPIG